MTRNLGLRDKSNALREVRFLFMLSLAAKLKSVFLLGLEWAFAGVALTHVGIAKVIGKLFGMEGNAKGSAIPGAFSSILIIRLDQTLGDSIMNVPLLAALRKEYPTASISLVAHRNLESFYRNCPYIDKVVFYEWGCSLPLSALLRPWLVLRFWRDHLRGHSPDLAILPRFDEDNHAAFLAYFSGAPVRIGYPTDISRRKNRLNAGFSSLLTHILPEAPSPRHEVERNLDVLRFLGKPQGHVFWAPWRPDEHLSAARELLTSTMGQLPRVRIILGLSSGHSRLKQWPLKHFEELARMLHKTLQDQLGFVFIGQAEDSWNAESLIQKLNVPTANLCGKTGLADLGAVIQECTAYVGNDSGLMHMAAAAGIPTIGIFGSSCPHRFGPWGEAASWVSSQQPCSPCQQYHGFDRCTVCPFPEVKCLESISPSEVHEKLIGILGHPANREMGG